ncbi:MAG: hypothetical protein LBQ84_01585 [Flavobacteriaceae bacterium]|jgi:hypothetical protein|nr:hypothetical protein [Flavobacteriaceae bacterium]
MKKIFIAIPIIIIIVLLVHYYHPLNYYTRYEIITYEELPQEVKDGFNNYIGESYEVGLICYDASEKCKDCSVYNDDRALIGLLTQREPHLVITNCGKEYEVPITITAAKLFVIYNDFMYFPKSSFFGADPGKKLNESEDFSKLEYGAIKLR